MEMWKLPGGEDLPAQLLATLARKGSSLGWVCPAQLSRFWWHHCTKCDGQPASALLCTLAELQAGG